MNEVAACLFSISLSPKRWENVVSDRRYAFCNGRLHPTHVRTVGAPNSVIEPGLRAIRGSARNPFLKALFELRNARRPAGVVAVKAIIVQMKEKFLRVRG